MKRVPVLLCFVLCLAFVDLSGCSEYEGDDYYIPHPALVNAPSTQPSQEPPAQVLATVLGIRRPDPKSHIPLSVEARLRLENTGAQPIMFDPTSLQLTSADLVQFPAPIVTPPMSIYVAPGLSTVVTADFPFPPGSTSARIDLSTIHLRWIIRIGDRAVSMARNFRNSSPPYYGYDPYYPGYPFLYDEPYLFFDGPVIMHHRW
jgi:hypothetical protein